MKEHTHFECGNKNSFAYTKGSGIIIGAMAKDGNSYDGYSFNQQLEQITELASGRIRKVIVDKGYQVRGRIRGVDILMTKDVKLECYYLKKKRVERFRSRSEISVLMSHLKHNQRMTKNCLNGTTVDQINTLLAATASNMRKQMRLRREEILNLILRWIYQTPILVPVNIPR